MYPDASVSRRGRGSWPRDLETDDPAALVLALIPKNMREIVETLRAIVKAAVPKASEKPQPRTKTFNYDHNGALLAISGYQNWASLGFVRGDELDDPHGILEGVGKGMRHVQVKRGADIPAEAIAGLVRQAAELNEKLGPPRGFGRTWGGGK